MGTVDFPSDPVMGVVWAVRVNTEHSCVEVPCRA